MYLSFENLNIVFNSFNRQNLPLSFSMFTKVPRRDSIKQTYITKGR